MFYKVTCSWMLGIALTLPSILGRWDCLCIVITACVGNINSCVGLRSQFSGVILFSGRRSFHAGHGTGDTGAIRLS